jgi:hypothetical protein
MRHDGAIQGTIRASTDEQVVSRTHGRQYILQLETTYLGDYGFVMNLGIPISLFGTCYVEFVSRILPHSHGARI